MELDRLRRRARHVPTDYVASDAAATPDTKIRLTAKTRSISASTGLLIPMHRIARWPLVEASSKVTAIR